MTREELLEKVNGELGSTKLTLSDRTINEELDDALVDFGDDEDANAKLVTRVAGRLKRMDGNLHFDVSAEVKKLREKDGEGKKLEPTGEKKPAQKQPSDGDNDELAEIKRQLAEMKADRERRDAEAAKNATLTSVRKELHAKFRAAGVEANEFFVDSAMLKLTMPEGEIDVSALAEKAEKQYYSDLKAAGMEEYQGPRRGIENGGKGATAASDYFKRKAKKEGWSK